LYTSNGEPGWSTVYKNRLGVTPTSIRATNKCGNKKFLDIGCEVALVVLDVSRIGASGGRCQGD